MIDLTLAQQIMLITGGICTLLIQYAGIVWRLSKIEHRIHQRIYEVQFELDKEIQKVRHELTESKLETSNTYMRRETFKDIFSNIDSRLIRLEGKLDTAIAINTKNSK